MQISGVAWNERASRETWSKVSGMKSASPRVIDKQ